jgi:hypothetical protein
LFQDPNVKVSQTAPGSNSADLQREFIVAGSTTTTSTTIGTTGTLTTTSTTATATFTSEFSHAHLTNIFD